jgi:AraC-like DNA-binding protein
MKMLSDGACVFRNELDIEGEGTAPFAVGSAWLVEIIEMRSGEFYFVSGDRNVRPVGKRWGAYYSRFSIVETVANNIRADVFGIGSFEAASGLPTSSFLFETDFRGPFRSAAEAADIVAAGREKQVIDINPNPSLISLKAKRLIDENYRVFPSIARIADRIGVTHEHLTRRFKRDYKMAPNAYLHRVRTAEASYKLQRGEEIIEVSADVGYNDLSRFYKQFRKGMKTSPGSCRA